VQLRYAPTVTGKTISAAIRRFKSAVTGNARRNEPKNQCKEKSTNNENEDGLIQSRGKNQ
jgi:hypothetical protein